MDLKKWQKNIASGWEKGKEKVYSAEDKLRDFILDPRFLTALFLVVVSVLAIVLRWLTRDFRTADYNNFLKPWFDVLKEGGGFPALKKSLGDYNVPYLTILAFLT